MAARKIVSIPSADIAGTADAITLTGSQNLVDGLTVVFLPQSANTAAVTIDYNGGGATNLLDQDGVALTAGTLKHNRACFGIL